MPGLHELIGLLVVIFIIWIILKVTVVAIRLVLLFIAAALIVGGAYWLFVR